jgi:hypothetical protein
LNSFPVSAEPDPEPWSIGGSAWVEVAFSTRRSQKSS